MISLIEAAERGWIPDGLIRVGMRRLLKKRLVQDRANATPEGKARFTAEMRQSPLAVATDDANSQHYEVPTALFQRMLGPRLKYSAALYPAVDATLSEAEEAMLALTVERAQLAEGQNILELGCGWGSLTLYMAARFPGSKITAVSNSASQKAYIDAEAVKRGFQNISVLTQDMNDFEALGQFDRVISIEMFEHMRNYEALFTRIAAWLKTDGLLFFHIFCHRDQPYFFEDDSNDDWMARHFFTGGLMPSFDLPRRFEGALKERDRWAVNGQHYANTCRDWLTNLDENRRDILRALDEVEHPDTSAVLWQRWRMFVMACQELFAYEGGETWFVGHYLYEQATTDDSHAIAGSPPD